MRLEHTFVCRCIYILRGWITLNTLYVVTFLTSKSKAAKDSLRVVVHEQLIIKVELLDCLSALSRQDLRCHQLHTLQVVRAELIVGIEDASQVVLVRSLEQNNFSLGHRYLNIQLSYLRDFCDQVTHLDVVIHLQHHVHGLVVVDVVVAFGELG